MKAGLGIDRKHLVELTVKFLHSTGGAGPLILEVRRLHQLLRLSAVKGGLAESFDLVKLLFGF